MRWTEIGDMHCSIARTLAVLGDRWTLLVLRELFLRSRRFEEFQAYLGLSSAILSARLARLVTHGIVRRIRYCEHPPRHEYRLTEKGRDLYPVMVSLIRWGDRWLAGPDGPPARLVHGTCGREMTPILVCPHCGELVDPRDVRPRLGAVLTAERADLRRAAGVRRSAARRKAAR